MKRSSILAMLMAGCAATAATPALPATPASAATAEAAFETVMTASRVADYARRKGDFNAMMTAANMMREVPMRDPAHPEAAATFSDGGYLAEARKLANGDGALLMQVQFAEQQEGDKGISSSMFGAGLLRVVKEIEPHSAYTVQVKARPNEMLRVGAIGDRTSPVGLTLRDRNGKAVCTDAGGAFSPVCQVQPGAATDFKVEVTNGGNAATKAIILSN